MTTEKKIMVHVRATDEIAHHIYGAQEHEWSKEIGVLALSLAAREESLRTYGSCTHVYVRGRYETEPVTPESWATLASQEIETAAAETREEHMRTVLDSYRAACVERTSDGWKISSYYSDCADDPRVVAWLAERVELLDRLEKEEREAKIAKKNKDAAEDAAKREKKEIDESARKAAVRALLSGSALEQYDRGLLSEDDQKRILRDAVLVSLADLPRYERITGSDLVHTDECYLDEITYSTEDAADTDRGLTSEEYRTLTEIEELMRGREGVKITPRVHEGKCTGCDAMKTRTSIRVEVTVGDWTLSREYAA